MFVTVSGSLYILFKDGTGFCRSKSGGPCAPADALYFAPSESAACKVSEHGGRLKVTSEPAVGSVPIYVNGPVRAVGDVIVLAPHSFRQGTQIVTINVV